MHLLSLTSTAQLNVLEIASNSTLLGSTWNFLELKTKNRLFKIWLDFYSEYWTGGRDAQTHAQFVWDFNETAVTSVAGIIGTIQDIQTCVSYVADTHKHIHSELCTGKLGVLCEIAT